MSKANALGAQASEHVKTMGTEIGLSAAACCSSQAVGINVDSSTPTVAVVWSAMNQAPMRREAHVW